MDLYKVSLSLRMVKKLV